jgi:signal peptidase II
MRTRTSARLALLLVALSTIGCDRVTKHAASNVLAGMPARTYLGDTVRLAYAENMGGFLSLGSALPPAVKTAVFTAGTGLCLLLLVVVLVRWQGGVLSALSLTLFAAGGLSNWLDRVVRGRVVDFMNVGIGSWRTGIFNVADVAIMIGACLFVVMEVRRPTNAHPRVPRRDSA